MYLSGSTSATACASSGWFLIGIGSVLLALTLGGYQVEATGRPADDPQARALVWCIERTQCTGAFDLAEAVERIHTGTEHSDDRRVRITEDWLQWSLGLCYEPLAHTQDTRLLLKDGQASCAERSQILKSMAELAGLRCRFVGLQGHVVLEVLENGVWRYADPDYGLCFDSDAETLAKPESLPIVAERLAALGTDPERIALYLHILGTADDNRVLPVGESISPRLDGAERICRVLRWLIPALAIIVGTMLRAFARR